MESDESFSSSSSRGYRSSVLQWASVDAVKSGDVSSVEATNEVEIAFDREGDKQVHSRPKRFIQIVAGWLLKTLAEGVIGWAIGEALSGSDKTVLKAIDRNYEAINRNYEAIQNVQKNVLTNTVLLIDIYSVVSETRQLVEKMMLAMQENFNRVLESLNDMRVAPLATGINNFIDYFLSEKEMISHLSDDEYLAKMRQQNDFLQYLKESRSPKGDSLRSSLYAILNQNLAIPRDAEDSAAFSAIQALYYGAQAYASVMLYLLEQYTRLAELCYRNGDLEGFNNNMDALVTHFKSFKQSLVGDGDSVLGNVIRVIKNVRDKSFVPKRGENSFRVLSGQAYSLLKLKDQLQDLSLPIILDVPSKISGRPSFPEPGVSTPLGDWKDGATVRYAVQYRSNKSYSKIGEWSTPMTVNKKANPTLEVPVDPKRRERLIFRQFNNESPQLVGVLTEKYETKFKDVNRDLFNAALNFDEDTAVREASVLIKNSADINSVFENGRGLLHAAAQSDNARLARDFLMANSSGLDTIDTLGYTPLHVAAKAGSSGFTELLLERGADVNAQTFEERLTPLHIAAYTGFVDTVDALLKSEAIDLNARDANGFSPLHSAVFGGEKVLRALMAHNGTDLNAESEAGMTPLHLAAVNNFVDIAESLLKGDSLDATAGAAGKLTALHFASMGGNAEVVKLLVSQNKVDVNAESIMGWTPLHFAVSLKNEEIASELLNCSRTAPESTGKNGITPLHVAAMTGQTTFLKSLIKKGVDAGKEAEDGKTALHFAAIHGSVKTISAALSLGIDVNNKTLEGLTPLHLAAASPFGSSEAVNYLVYKGANVKDVPESGENCLHLAASGGVLDVVKYFVDKGVAINAQDRSGRRPLHAAAVNGRLEAVHYLAEKGATGGETKNRETLLHLAALSGHLGVVRTVASNSSDVDSKDKSGHTPLYVAFRNNHTDIVKYLVEAGNADVNVKFEGGDTLLHFASSAGNLDVVDLSVRNGADCCATNEGGLSPLVSAAKNGRLNVVKYLPEKTNVDLESACNFLARPVAAHHGHLDVVESLGNRRSSSTAFVLDHFLSLLVAIENGHIDVVHNLLREEIRFPLTYTVPNFEPRASKRSKRSAIKISLCDPKFAWLCSGLLPLREVATENFDETELDGLSRFLFFLLLMREHEMVVTVGYMLLALTAGKNRFNVSKLIIDNKIADVGFEFSGINLIALGTVAAYGYLSLLRYLIESKHLDIDTEDETGMSPLLLAAQCDHFDVVRYLVDSGAKLISRKGISPLFLAAANGNLRMCEYLLQKGCDINATGSSFDSKVSFLLKPLSNLKTSFEGSALSNAVRYGHSDLVRFLMGKGANLNAKYVSNFTPLHVAAETGQLDILKYFVEECKVNVDLKDGSGRTPSYYAVWGGHLDALKYLEGKGANSSSFSSSFESDTVLSHISHVGVLKYLIEKGFTFKDSLLLDAADNGNLEAIKCLVKNGTPVDYREEEGWFTYKRTAMHFAADNGHLDVVKYLVEKERADVDVEDSYRWTPVHYAARHGHLNVTEYLVTERKAKPDIEGTDKNTPLSTSLKRLHKNVAEFLKKKAHVSCRQDKLSECLEGATELGMVDLAKQLVGKGANVTRSLEKAFTNYQFEIAEVMIEKGASVNARFELRKTPLHFAAEKGNLAFFQYLVRKGAVVDVEDQNKLSPLFVAKMYCNSAVADFIVGMHLKRNRRSTSYFNPPFLPESHDFDFPENEHLMVEKNQDLKLTAGGGQSAIGPGKSSSHVMGLAQRKASHSSNKLVENPGAMSGHTNSGSSRPSSWINTLSHAVVDAFMGLSRFVPSPFQSSIATEQQAAPKEAPHTLEVDTRGTLFLLDVLVRRWTGEKYIAPANQVMSPREVAVRAADVTGKFVAVLRRAAVSTGISPHRVDVDVAEALSVVGRKLTSGNIRGIAGELRSLVVQACPGLEAGCPGRLSSRKFEMFLDEVDRDLEAVLDQVMMEVVQTANRSPKFGKIMRQTLVVGNGGYIEHSSLRLPLPQAGVIDRRKELP